MWESPDGIRTLEGAEAELVRAALCSLLDELEAVSFRGTYLQYGVRPFDELDWQQQWALLARVARALLREDAEAPVRCAVDDAAVEVIFQAIRSYVKKEIRLARKGGSSTEWRQRVLACVDVRELFPRLNVDETHTNFGRWEVIIETVRDNILVDGDWAMGKYFMDAEPDVSSDLKSQMNIDNAYYVIPAPDPTEDEWPDIVNEFDALVGYGLWLESRDSCNP